jgi:hypothetical protein
MRLSMLMILLGLVSCGGNGGGGNGTKASSPVQETQNGETSSEDTTSENATFELEVKRKTELSDDHANLDEFKTDINVHNVQIKALTGNYKNSEVVCIKTHFDGTKTSFSGAFDSRGTNAKVEIQLLENDPAEVVYDCSISQDGHELDHKNVKIQKSYIVSDKKNFADYIAANSVGTILIEKNGELSTDGALLNIYVKSLISLGGKLVTFPADRVSTTSDNRPGASGGAITLEAQSATGDLLVELRGLNGGKQTRSQPKNQKVPPFDPSKNGNCSGQHASNDQRCFGKQGPKGYQGLQGLTGLPGGDAGLLVFTTIKKSNINLEVKHFPGVGSEGGLGGEGGVGGPGGIGSHVSWKEHKDGPRGCPMCSPMDSLDNSSAMTTERYKFPDGTQGPKGEVGVKGEFGPKGNILESNTIFSDEDMEFIFNYDWKNF